MRLVIQEGPLEASNYIAEYIISEYYCSTLPTVNIR